MMDHDTFKGLIPALLVIGIAIGLVIGMIFGLLVAML